MAFKFTEEQLNTLDKSFIVNLFLQLQDQNDMLSGEIQELNKKMEVLIVSAKYCYAAHESRLHQNDRCKRFALCLVLTVRFRSLAPWGKLFQLFI